MNSDWTGLESVLLKIFPGAQVATDLKNCNNQNILYNHLSLLTTLVILPCCLQVLESFSDRRTYSVEQVIVTFSFPCPSILWSRFAFRPNSYSYSVEQEAVQSLASAFQHLEQCKSDFNIEDYSLSQTTLEQVLRTRN